MELLHFLSVQRCYCEIGERIIFPALNAQFILINTKVGVCDIDRRGELTNEENEREKKKICIHAPAETDSLINPFA